MKHKRYVFVPYLDRIKWIHYAMFHYTSNGSSRHMGHNILSRKCFIVIIKVHNSLFMNTDTSLDTMYRSFVITFFRNELSHTLTTRIKSKIIYAFKPTHSTKTACTLFLCCSRLSVAIYVLCDSHGRLEQSFYPGKVKPSIDYSSCRKTK